MLENLGHSKDYTKIRNNPPIFFFYRNIEIYWVSKKFAGNYYVTFCGTFKSYSNAYSNLINTHYEKIRSISFRGSMAIHREYLKIFPLLNTPKYSSSQLYTHATALIQQKTPDVYDY